MSAEEIVRELAGFDTWAFTSQEGLEGCLLCGHGGGLHEPGCVYTKACAWVEAHPASGESGSETE